jgi:hypothetical protein
MMDAAHRFTFSLRNEANAPADAMIHEERNYAAMQWLAHALETSWDGACPNHDPST